VKLTASWSVLMHNNPAWCSPSGAGKTSRKLTLAKDLRNPVGLLFNMCVQ